MYKSFVLVADSQNDDYACQMFQTIEDVIKQTKENCLGFFQDQASLYAQIWENQFEMDRMDPQSGPRSVPPIAECLKAYLPKGDEDLQEEKPEFPTVNKLIQELVLIQKHLSNKPWKENIIKLHCIELHSFVSLISLIILICNFQ